MARVRVEVPVEQKPTAHKPPTKSVEHHKQEHSGAQKPPQGNFQMKKAFVVGALIFGLIFVYSLIQERNRLQDQLEGKDGDGQTAQIVKTLSRTIELPADETPESRTIEDASKFTEQNPSLSDIKDGDVLLFFAKSQKVVVYRPDTKKAVVVVKLAQPSAQQPNSGQQ